jgi:hypothetical protein
MKWLKEIEHGLKEYNSTYSSGYLHHYFAPTDIARLIAALKVATEALEFYENHIPYTRMITHESADYEREYGIGRKAREALAKIREGK